MKTNYLFFVLVMAMLSRHTPAVAQGITIPPPYGPSPADTFPLPPLHPNELFYLQRTSNTNTVIYDLNTRADGSLDPREPVIVYWIRYGEGGQKKELDFVQRRFAYGIKHEMLDAEKKSYILKMVAYDKRPIYLIRSQKTNQYKAYINIQGKMNELTRIYLHIEGGSFWIPNVIYIELTGRDILTGKTISERFIP